MQVTQHAQRRLAQRGVGSGAVDFTLRFGGVYHRTGIVFVVLRRVDIPDDLRHDSLVDKWVGTTVLLAPDGEVITVYKNPESPRDIRKKVRWRDLGLCARVQQAA